MSECKANCKSMEDCSEIGYPCRDKESSNKNDAIEHLRGLKIHLIQSFDSVGADSCQEIIDMLEQP